MGEYWFFSGIFSFVGIALFIISGFAQYKMSKSIGFKYAWLGFVPVISVYSLGRIAATYVKKDGSKSAKFGPILLVLNILQYILVAVFLVFTIISVIEIVGNAEDAISQNIAMELDMFVSVVPVIISFFVLFAVEIAFLICFHIALWRVYVLFDEKNATIFTVLSVFFNFLTPIFLFLIRKKQPTFCFKDNLN